MNKTIKLAVLSNMCNVNPTSRTRMIGNLCLRAGKMGEGAVKKLYGVLFGSFVSLTAQLPQVSES